MLKATELQRFEKLRTLSLTNGPEAAPSEAAASRTPKQTTTQLVLGDLVFAKEKSNWGVLDPPSNNLLQNEGRPGVTMVIWRGIVLGWFVFAVGFQNLLWILGKVEAQAKRRTLPSHVLARTIKRDLALVVRPVGWNGWYFQCFPLLLTVFQCVQRFSHVSQWFSRIVSPFFNEFTCFSRGCKRAMVESKSIGRVVALASAVSSAAAVVVVMSGAGRVQVLIGGPLQISMDQRILQHYGYHSAKVARIQLLHGCPALDKQGNSMKRQGAPVFWLMMFVCVCWMFYHIFMLQAIWRSCLSNGQIMVCA